MGEAGFFGEGLVGQNYEGEYQEQKSGQFESYLTLSLQTTRKDHHASNFVIFEIESIQK